MRYNVHIIFENENPEVCVKALVHEGNDIYKRTVSEVYVEGNKVHIKIKAKDATALRASLNDYARLIKICEVEGV